MRDGKVDAALSLQLTREDPLYRSIDEQVQLIVDKENEPMRAQRASVDVANRRSLMAMGTLAVASVLLALIGGFVISWAFILPVQAASRVPERRGRPATSPAPCGCRTATSSARWPPG